MLRVWSAKTLCLRSPMATRGALVRFDAVRLHRTAYSAYRTVGSARPRMQWETRF